MKKNEKLKKANRISLNSSTTGLLQDFFRFKELNDQIRDRNPAGLIIGGHPSSIPTLPCTIINGSTFEDKDVDYVNDPDRDSTGTTPSMPV